MGKDKKGRAHACIVVDFAKMSATRTYDLLVNHNDLRCTASVQRVSCLARARSLECAAQLRFFYTKSKMILA